MILRKKLLILLEWFSPGFKAGGPIKSCMNLAFALKNDYEIYILTTDTDHGEKLPYEGIKINEWINDNELNVKIFYAQKSHLSFKQIKQQINFVNADYIYLNLMFSPHFVIFPIWLKFNNKVFAQLILSPRGALYDSALNLKWYKKRPLLFLYNLINIQRFTRFHATNEREKLAIEYFFKNSKVIIANNLPNIHQLPNSCLQKNPNKINCIFIARIVPIKNLSYILNALLNISAEVNFSIVGPAENELYWNECKAMIVNLPKNIKVTYLGAKNSLELLALLQKNHLFILPTTGENFGHSIFESLLAGRPVLISDQTPWLNLNFLNVGWDIPLNQPHAFVNALEAAAAWNQEDFNKSSQAAWHYANEFINQPSLSKPYYQLFS